MQALNALVDIPVNRYSDDTFEMIRNGEHNSAGGHEWIRVRSRPVADIYLINDKDFKRLLQDLEGEAARAPLIAQSVKEGTRSGGRTLRPPDRD